MKKCERKEIFLLLPNLRSSTNSFNTLIFLSCFGGQIKAHRQTYIISRQIVIKIPPELLESNTKTAILPPRMIRDKVSGLSTGKYQLNTYQGQKWLY